MQVLVTCPDAYDRRTFGAVPGHDFHFLDGPASHWRPTPDFDVLEYLERCRAYAREHGIEAVVSTHDLGDLLAAILARDLGLPGPSVEAVFLCLHKYYGRRREPAPIGCEALRLDDPHVSIRGYPCFLKAPWLKLGLLGFKLEGPEDLDRALAVARREYPAWSKQYAPLFREHIDRGKFPLATEDILLVEEFVEGPQVTVDGWSFGDEVRVWAITDTNLYPGSRAIDNFSLPSRHPAELQAEMARYAEEVVRAFGFRDGFWNIEFWCLPEGLKLIEVNGRSAACFNGLYEGVLDASIFAAAVELACGRDPGPPPAPKGKVGGQFNFLTFGEGLAEDLLDFEAARQVPGFSPVYKPGDQLRQVSEFGLLLGQVELFGETYEQIRAEAEGLRRKLLRSPGPPRGV